MTESTGFKRSLRDTWPTIAVESLLIVFSILLALGVNAWRDARRQADVQAQALANIQRELERNLAELERTEPYHRVILTGIDSLLAASLPPDRSLFDLLPTIAERGLNPPVLQRAAWETALTTNALAEVSYDELYPLHLVYFVQEVGLQQTLPRISELVLSEAAFEPAIDARPLLQRLRVNTQELAAQEATLIDFHRAALERLGEL